MAVAPAVADAFLIEGSRRLSGTINVAGNKNGALPILAASLLAQEPVTIGNIPRIRDVDTMVELLVDLGADVSWIANEVRIDTSGVAKSSPDERLCSRIRASFLLAGPLLARFGKVTMPPPGGDVIGRRRLDPHIHAFNELGADIDLGGRLYEMRAEVLRGANVFLDEASVMATENAVMAAVLAEGETVLGNAACEPHVQDLCRFLVSLGAEIEGIESNVLRINGVHRLGGGSWSIGPDHIEVGSFIGMAAITGGDVTIEGTRSKDLISIIPAFGKLGVRVEVGEESVHVPCRQQLIVQDDLGGMVPKIEDGPWPAFPSDLTSIAVTVATQAFGTVLMFEKMFENRLFFTDKLVSMGARIILCDPHRAVVTGPARLVGQRMESPDIRAGMAMLLAALAAEGQSTIGAAHQIDKGYERIDDRLRTLGASIERIES
jgi:UDP-N-acetylglucosamine 1-carboxyvinyltransferase